MFIRSFIGVAAALLLSAAPALAHHAFSADFDRDKPITLDGTITKVEWTNPHAYVYLDVKDTSGHTTNWKLEFGSRDELAGWTTPPLQVGQQIKMRGWQAKDGSKFANADSLTLASWPEAGGGLVLLRQLRRFCPSGLAGPKYGRGWRSRHSRGW